eukprot:gene645-212_t
MGDVSCILSAGRVVQVQGLKKQPQYNQLHGYIGGLLRPNGRWPVVLFRKDDGMKILSLLPKNLRALAPEILQHPGEPVLESEKGLLLHTIRNGKHDKDGILMVLGDVHACHVGAEASFAAGRDKKIPLPQYVVLDVATIRRRAKKLDKSRNHFYHIRMPAVRHDFCLEKVVGGVGWRLWHCFIMSETAKRLRGYTLLEWCSADTTGRFAGPLPISSVVEHPYKKWGANKVISDSEAERILAIVERFQQLQVEIVDYVLPQLPIGPKCRLPKDKNSIFGYMASAMSVDQYMKDIGNAISEKGLAPLMFGAACPGVDPQFSRFKFNLPTKQNEEFRRLFCTLTGEEPLCSSYVGMIVYAFDHMYREFPEMGFSNDFIGFSMADRFLGQMFCLLSLFGTECADEVTKVMEFKADNSFNIKKTV